MESFSREDHPDCWNAQLVSSFGFQLCQGLKAFAENDFEEAFRLLRPIRFDWLQKMQGSRAQVDLLNQVLIQSAVKSGDKRAALKLLKERLTSCTSEPQDENTLNQRLSVKIHSMV